VRLLTEIKNLTMAYVVLKKEPHRAYEKGRMIQTQDRMSRENTRTFVARGRVPIMELVEAKAYRDLNWNL
jgi:hypothetical protein